MFEKINLDINGYLHVSEVKHIHNDTRIKLRNGIWTRKQTAVNAVAVFAWQSSPVVLSQNAVSAYFTIKQILLFGFALHSGAQPANLVRPVLFALFVVVSVQETQKKQTIAGFNLAKQVRHWLDHWANVCVRSCRAIPALIDKSR